MTATANRTPDPVDLAVALIDSAPAAPPHLTSLASEVEHYRAHAAARARAEVTDPELLAEVLDVINIEAGYSHAMGAGQSVAEAAMIDLDNAVDYFGIPLSRARLAQRKRAATLAAKQLARKLLADPLVHNDDAWFGEGMYQAIERAREDEDRNLSDVSPAVLAEVNRLLAKSEVA